MATVPVPNFRFAILWNEQPIVRIQKVSGVKRTVAVTEHRDGAAPGETTKAPGHVTHHPITLERAVTGDTYLSDLADSSALAQPGSNVRGTLTIELQDETGRQVMRCMFVSAWVSSYEIFVELDVQGDAPAVERVVFEYDKWQIDMTPGPTPE